MKAEYVSHMGNDLTVVNAARVSFDKQSDWEWEYVFLEDEGTVFPGINLPHLSEKDSKLIKYLSSHNHWTPFSHCQITLRETVPIFVARQRFKHMVGFTYNEVSRRYVTDPPQFYVPTLWHTPAKDRKQGTTDNPAPNQEEIRSEYFIFLSHAESIYTSMLAAGVAPEEARMVLPQSLYTSYYVTGSLAAWGRAYLLRIDPHAQKEMQELAKQWSEIIRPLYPISWDALTIKG